MYLPIMACNPNDVNIDPAKRRLEINLKEPKASTDKFLTKITGIIEPVIIVTIDDKYVATIPLKALLILICNEFISFFIFL